jgi:ferredoxin-NADP reductase
MRSYTLSGLNEDSSYTITVRAINTAGSSMVTSVMGDTSTAGELLRQAP